MNRLVFSALLFLLAFAPIRAQEAPPPALGILMQTLDKSEDPATQANLLRGIIKALEGRRGVPAPAAWEALAAKLAQSPNQEVREQVQTLGAIFGSSSALAAMRQTLGSNDADRAARGKALESLVAAKDKETLPLLLDLARAPGPLRRAALRGLAAFDDPRIPQIIVSAYPNLDGDEKREALATLLARVDSAKVLTTALDGKVIPTTDVGAPQIRQLKGFKDAQIEEWLKQHPALTLALSNKQDEIKRLKAYLIPEQVANGDVSRGRALFTQTCAICHKLFDTGADLGPELTGANRTDVDYLLQNILDPNALIGKDYQSTTVETKDGRLVVGLVKAEDANALTLKTLAGPVTVPHTDIKSVNVSEVSLMPEGLLAALKLDQIRDLFAYLGSAQQTPMMATEFNAPDFFNGRDFTRWRKSSDAWQFADATFVGHGRPDKLETLVSEMVLRNFKLTGQFKVGGDKAAVEIVLRGRGGDELFRGFSMSFGGNTPSNVWMYHPGIPPQPAPIVGPIVETGKWVPLEIESRGAKIIVKLAGQVAYDFSAPSAESRTIPAFYLLGDGAEFAVKDLKVEVLP
jgi:putative heme-binding domain-containing protein